MRARYRVVDSIPPIDRSAMPHDSRFFERVRTRARDVVLQGKILEVTLPNVSDAERLVLAVSGKRFAYDEVLREHKCFTVHQRRNIVYISWDY